MAYMRLGDLLIASGVITQEQLDKALAVQKETHQRLGDVLMQNGFITERNLLAAMPIQLGVEFVDLTAVSIPVAPALRNAVLHATGVAMDTIPMTPQRLIEAFQAKGLI
mgnify:CR=1 FL=1